MRVVVVLACFLTAGCTGPDPEPAETETPTESADVPDAWQGRRELRIVDRSIVAGATQEFDVLCAFGGTASFELPELASIPSDASRLRFTVTSEATTTGVQAGYRDRDGLHWLPVVSIGSQEFFVDIPAGAKASAWAFHYQLNLPAEQDCYTGASVGGYAVAVDAMRG